MNVGKNKGRRLKLALSRFAAMLIEEARDITGFSYAELDEKLGLPDGQSYRYSLYPITAKTRAPQAAGIQKLENRVAHLLIRVPHKVVIENNKKISAHSFPLQDHIEGHADSNLNFREYEAADFQLGYENDWPTYRRLKSDPENLFGSGETISELLRLGTHDRWPEMLRIYSWQWGSLWDRGLPWLRREYFGIDRNEPPHLFVPLLVERALRERALLSKG